MTYVTTDLVRADYQEYYNGFANRVLWPILHYRLDLAEYSRRDLTGYMRVNEHFADAAVTSCCSPTTSIWVHDYHLMPLAKALRERGHENRIGFFLHVPFPPPEILTALPNHERLIPPLCHYDLVGFQTDNDADNLRALSRGRMPAAEPRPARTFVAGSGTVRIGTFPVGVETAEFERLARRVGALAVRAERGGKPRRPRDDHRRRPARLFQGHRAAHGGVRAVPRRSSRTWRGKVTYLQITPRSRSEIQEYAEMERAIGEAASAASTARYGEAVVDADPLRQPAPTAVGACRTLSRRAGRRW